jgi:hypothetical protein
MATVEMIPSPFKMAVTMQFGVSGRGGKLGETQFKDVRLKEITYLGHCFQFNRA